MSLHIHAQTCLYRLCSGFFVLLFLVLRAFFSFLLVIIFFLFYNLHPRFFPHWFILEKVEVRGWGRETSMWDRHTNCRLLMFVWLAIFLKHFWSHDGVWSPQQWHCAGSAGITQLPRASRDGADPGPLPPQLGGFLHVSGAAFLGPPCLTECIMSAMVWMFVFPQNPHVETQPSMWWC